MIWTMSLKCLGVPSFWPHVPHVTFCYRCLLFKLLVILYLYVFACSWLLSPKLFGRPACFVFLCALSLECSVFTKTMLHAANCFISYHLCCPFVHVVCGAWLSSTIPSVPFSSKGYTTRPLFCVSSGMPRRII